MLLAVQLAQDTGVKLSASHVRNVLVANHVRRGRSRAGLRIPVRGRRRTLKKIDHLVKRTSDEDEVFYLDEADIDLTRGSVRPTCAGASSSSCSRPAPT